jgi:aldehyde:ferredoxin oxidoreductase
MEVIIPTGIIGKEDTGGIELTWGDPNAIIKIVELIGLKMGFEAILGEGSMRAAEKIGKGADRYAMHVKGLEIPMHNPYRFKEMGLQYATSERGACHLRGLSMLPARGVLIPDIGLNKKLDGFAIDGKAHVVKIMQDACRMIDALGICKFIVFFGGIPLKDIAKIYTAVTGWETTLEDLMKAGERIWMLQRTFNVRMGIRVSTYVRLHRSWASPDSSTSRVHRRLVTALRPRQEVPTHSQALPVTGEVFESHGELPPSSARMRCTYPSSYPSSEVFGLLLSPYCPCTRQSRSILQPI